MSDVRHKCFISYHHDDQEEVDEFVATFDDERKVFIARGIGLQMEQDIIDSTDTECNEAHKELYLKDSTVTIVLMGKCTGEAICGLGESGVPASRRNRHT